MTIIILQKIAPYQLKFYILGSILELEVIKIMLHNKILLNYCITIKFFLGSIETVQKLYHHETKGSF